MGTTVYLMNVSIDGRIGRTVDENGVGDWLRISDALHEDINRRAAQFSTMVQGRVVYEIMEGFWPAAADDERNPGVIREYGRLWRDVDKVLVSTSRREAPFNTRVIGNDGRSAALAALAELRRDSNGRIGVGGAGIATQLLQHGLLDELLLYVHPAYLGTGRPLFDDIDGAPASLSLELLEQQTFEQGVQLQRYAIRR